MAVKPPWTNHCEPVQAESGAERAEAGACDGKARQVPVVGFQAAPVANGTVWPPVWPEPPKTANSSPVHTAAASKRAVGAPEAPKADQVFD